MVDKQKRSASEQHKPGERALEALHTLEDSAVDTYHALEDHNAVELQQDVKGLLTHLREWLQVRAQRYKAWYLQQPPYLKILYGLTVLPITIVIGLIVLLFIKFGAPILLVSALVVKFSIVAVKTLFFIGYIAYKIIKTILMWYITLSRMFTGRKAKNKRFDCAERREFNIEPDAAAASLSFRCKQKDLYVINQQQNQLRILFSYLRYALRGQKLLLQHIGKDWRAYLTLWRQHSRDVIRQAIAPVGASMFTPHELGADVTADGVLVPGDAELTLICVNPDDSLSLSFHITWVEWQFTLRKAIKFLHIERQHRATDWQVHNITLRKPDSVVKSG